jgi:ABC-type Mn2+/Zn2+ transport system permease subunit
MGGIVSAAGILASFRLDLPTGATIVCTFGVALVLLALVRIFVKGPGAAPA